MKRFNLNKQIKISLLSVMAFLLMFIEVSIPIFPQFLKIDISDLPALIGTFALGPLSGVLIEFFKNLFHGLFVGKTAFVGEFANFSVGSLMVITSGIIYKINRTKKNAILGLIIGTLVMSLGAGILNYFVLLPLYESVLNIPIDAIVEMSGKVNHNITNLNTLIVWAIIPLNILKGSIISVITIALYKKVSPLLHADDAVTVEQKILLNFKKSSIFNYYNIP